MIGGSITAAVAVPLADAFGGWRASFAIVSAAAFGSLAAWLWLMPRGRGPRPRRALAPEPPVAAAIGLAARRDLRLAVDPVLRRHHLAGEHLRGARLGPGEAGSLIALFTGIGLIRRSPCRSSPTGSARGGASSPSRRWLSIAGAVVIAATPSEPPGSSLTLGGDVLLGLGIGAYFPLALTLPVDVARDPADAASISALMLLVGYLLAATAPVVLGLVRDATGDFEAGDVDPRRRRRGPAARSRSTAAPRSAGG